MRMVRWTLAVLGVLVLALGLFGAYLVGSDNLIMSSPQEVEVSGPVVTEPAALAFADAEVVIEASSDDGVFLGTGNPIDVESLVAGTKHYRVADFERTGLRGLEITGKDVDADDDLPEIGEPGDLDIWADKASGSGTQRLTLDRSGDEPIALLAAPEGNGTVSLAFGTKTPGLFAKTLIVAGIGLLMLGGALVSMLLSRRDRTPKPAPPAPPAPTAYNSSDSHAAWGQQAPVGVTVTRPPPTPTPTPPVAPPPPEEPPTAFPGSTSPPTQPRPSTPPPTAPPTPPPAEPPTQPPPPRGWPQGRWAIALGLCLVLTSCAQNPETVKPSAATVVALETDAQAAFWADYDARNNVAIEQSTVPPYDPEAWTQADTGLVLEHDRYQTEFNELSENSAEPSEFTHDPINVYSQAFDSYPTWVLMQSTAVVPGDDPTYLNVMVRDGVRSPWLAAADVALYGEFDVPDPVDPSEAEADETYVEAGDRATDAIAEWWESGELTSDEVSMSAALEDIRDDVISPHAIKNTIITADRYDGDLPSTWTIRVDGGTVAIRTLELNVRFNARKGFQIRWDTDINTELYGPKGEFIEYPAITTMAIFIPDDGQARVLGGDVRKLLKDNGL